MTTASVPRHRALSIAFAAIGPAAIGGILAIRAHHATPLFAVPAIVFGVVAATAPALYIATAATGSAPPVATVARALVASFGAFGVALVGLVLPAAFLALSSIGTTTTVVVTTGALAGAAILSMRRLASELGTATIRKSLAASCVFGVWALATLGIAARLWTDFALEVIS